MFVNKLFTYLTCAYLRKYFNVEFSACYFHMKICVSVPLNITVFGVFTQIFSSTQNHGQMLYKNRSSLAIWLMLLTWNFT